MIVDQTSIIPINQRFYNEQTNKLVSWEVNAINNLDLKAIASFCSLGFMLDNDTFYNDIKVLQPSTKITLNNSNSILSREKTWEWHYNPIERPFEEILDEFTNLINRLVLDKVRDRSILLPISGGIDSRTLFVPVKYEPNLTLSAYEFEGGHNLPQALENLTAEELEDIQTGWPKVQPPTERQYREQPELRNASGLNKMDLFKTFGIHKASGTTDVSSQNPGGGSKVELGGGKHRPSSAKEDVHNPSEGTDPVTEEEEDDNGE